MQGNSLFCCVRPTSPYLSIALKPDNLTLMRNNNSEKVLREGSVTGEKQVKPVVKGP